MTTNNAHSVSLRSTKAQMYAEIEQLRAALDRTNTAYAGMLDQRDTLRVELEQESEAHGRTLQALDAKPPAPSTSLDDVKAAAIKYNALARKNEAGRIELFDRKTSRWRVLVN